jgi:Fe-S cluster assembly protein SufB
MDFTRIRSGYLSYGLNEDIVHYAKEPQWMTDWRIESFRAWQEMTEPEWANVHYAKDFQAISIIQQPKRPY